MSNCLPYVSCDFALGIFLLVLELVQGIDFCENAHEEQRFKVF